MLEQAIEDLRSDDYQTWIQAWNLLFMLRNPEMIAPLITALGDKHPRVRESAARALGYMPDPRSVVPLIALLPDAEGNPSGPSDPIGATAAWALGEIGDTRAVEPLIQALDYSHRGILGPAIKSLAKIGDRRAVEPLIRVMTRTYDASIATILGNFGDRLAVEPLIRLLQTPPESKREQQWYPNFRYYAVRALGKLGDSRALPILEQLQAEETAPLLKGKSLSDMAAKAIERINAENPSEPLLS